MDKKNVSRLAGLLREYGEIQSEFRKQHVVSFLNKWNGTVAALLFERARLIEPLGAARFSFEEFSF